VLEIAQARNGQARFWFVGVVHADQGATLLGGDVVALHHNHVTHACHSQMAGCAGAIHARPNDHDIRGLHALLLSGGASLCHAQGVPRTGTTTHIGDPEGYWG
jgi:hypothetical protein